MTEAWLNRTHVGDCRYLLRRMSEDGVKVQTCVTSPPYFGLRDYGVADQIGLEATPDEYVAQMVAVFSAVSDVLADDGTLWLNLGDSYAGSNQTGGTNSKEIGRREERMIAGRNFAGKRDPWPGSGIKAKDLCGIPWRVAFALQADGWYLRSDIIWHKPNPMPESVTDRPTKAHEYLFLLAKSERYYYDQDAIAEESAYAGEQAGICRGTKRRAHAMGLEPTGNEKPGMNWIQPETRNRRTVWTITTKPQPESHFACFPPDLIEPCILAGAPAGGIVLDPFMGSGTTARVAMSLGRQFIGCELNPAYVEIQDKIGLQAGMLFV
jgi:DNA modification methylase